MHREAAGILLLAICGAAVGAGGAYLGREVGALSRLAHGVRGRVFAVDARTIYIHELHYDGEGPAAYFYVGRSGSPTGAAGGGVRLRDEAGGSGALRRYAGEGVALSLPEGLAVADLRWLAVWCDDFSVNFGSVTFPPGLAVPRPARVGALSGAHGVSSEPVVVVDAQTLLVPAFSYDGEAPDAKFWVGRGATPSPAGVRIPDENGKEDPLRKYDKKTIVLTLPGELTVFDIGHFGVWCEAFTVDFGHVELPRNALANVPPSLRMLGVSPQSKLNCEVLLEDLAFEVRWAVAGDSIVLQLVAKLEDGEYMSFGVSGSGSRSQMVGADVAVAWLEQRTLRGHAVDYFLDAKSQCAGARGSCPDEALGEKTNSLRLLNAALVGGYSIVTYQRALRAADELDRPVLVNASQPIVWAVGPLNSRGEVSYHSHFLKGDKFLEFGRPPVWNCPMPESEEEQSEPPSAPALPAAPASRPEHKHKEHKNKEHRKPEHADRDSGEVSHSAALSARPPPPPAPVPSATPWDIPPVRCYEPADGVLYAQLGPTGGRQGYSAITGHVGWGISWYINGLLIPEVHVVRGRKYTFVVEGGANPDLPAKYHPFYITNDPIGGYFHKSDEEKQGVEIYAGVRRSRNGNLVPTGVGRLCNWTPDARGPAADEYPSFGAYQRSLTLVCEEGNPGVITWTPDANTPDTVYYQCFTHRHLGWKIRVVDECDEEEGEEAEASLRVETVAQAPSVPDDGDLLQGEESIQVPARLAPQHNHLTDKQKPEQIINSKPTFSNVNSDVTHGDRRPQRYHSNQTEIDMPISKLQIKEVIQAAESLEHRAKEEYLRNQTKHNLHEDDFKDLFLPEQPVGEDGEYVVEQKMPSNYMLPPNQKPLTLQAVLRPNGKPNSPNRPPFRRPVPPEIKLRRPPFHKPMPNNYPLPMPGNHGPHPGHMQMKKPFGKPMRPPNMNRPMQIPPMKAMPSHGPSPGFSHPPPPKPLNKLPPGMMPPIVMGKPPTVYPMQSQTLSLGKTDLIGNQVVKSQITLPNLSTVVEPVAQHNIPQPFYSKPGQIILGKPMENPVPLDQQMTPTKLHSVIREPVTVLPERQNETPLRLKSDSNRPQASADMKPSDFITESTEQITMTPAVNTGFKPNTIVIESGFKPIIREPLMASEDRITDFDGNNPFRREDTDIEDEYEEAPQKINHQVFPPSEKITETFEPMFIPSPEDHISPTAADVTKEVFPSNHAKEDRPHPVYVKSESELNALFSKQNMDKKVPSELSMESNRISPSYLPPHNKNKFDHKKSEPTLTSYDGKVVSATSFTREVDDNRSDPSLPPKVAELLKSNSQLPISPKDIPETVKKHIDGSLTEDAPVNSADSNSQLKLYNAFIEQEKEKEKEKEKQLASDLDAASSQKNETIERKDTEYHEMEEDDYYDDEETDNNKQRRKRETPDMQFDQPSSNKNVTKSQDFHSRTESSANFLKSSLVSLLSLCIMTSLL